MKRGQVMLETVLAVIFVTFVFLVLFELAYSTNERIILDYAAQRSARAKTVGLNDFMCRKTARLAAIPVSGSRQWPTGDEEFDALNKFRNYLESEDESTAFGILRYSRWEDMDLNVYSGGGLISDTKAEVRFAGGFIRGEAKVEAHAPYYMQ